jgi:hypothetical protein
MERQIIQVFNVKPDDVPPPCQHIFPKGRHCRRAASGPDSQYCVYHARFHRPAASALASATDLASKLKQVSSAADVTDFLAGLLNLLAENRISVRRAAVLTYIANSMLHSLRAEQREDSSGPLFVDWSSIPRPDRSEPDSSNPPVTTPTTP